MDDKGESPPPPEEGLERERCPSCGGKLTYEEGRDQGFCAIEGIYVEVLVPPPDVERPPLVREAVLQATKRDLQRLCKAYGMRVSGNKTDVLTRLLRYMDDHGIDVPPEDKAEEEVEEPPREEARAEDVDTLLEEVEHLAAQPTPPQEVPPERAEEAEERPERPEPVYVDTTAAAAVSEEAVREEESFLLEAAGMETPEEPVAAPEAAEAPAAEPPAPAVDEGRLRRDRFALNVGTLLVALGGPGLVIGSILHDIFRVPLFGDTYDAFGPLNVAVALVGGIILAAGLVAMGVGLRGGVVRTPAAEEG